MTYRRSRSLVFIMLDHIEAVGEAGEPRLDVKHCPRRGIFEVKYCIPSDSTKISRQAENRSLYRYILWRKNHKQEQKKNEY